MRKKLPSTKSASQTTSNPWKELTVRELDIILGLCAGYTTRKDLAKHLGIAEKTISVHVTSICRKLDCKNAVGIVAKAMREGL